MLPIQTEKTEFWLDLGEGFRFYYADPVLVNMEHSLISIAKWEQRWHKPYLPSPMCESGVSTTEEELSYIECMIIGKVGPLIPSVLRTSHGREITDYINNKASATTIYRIGKQRQKQTTITAELIYYWMIHFKIPFECQKWHLNTLLTLIDVCSVKELEASGDKRGRLSNIEAANYRTELNRKRRGLT